MTNGFIMTYEIDGKFIGQITFSNGHLVHVEPGAHDDRRELTEKLQQIADDRNINIYSVLES